MSNYIVTDALHKYYGRNHVLHGISLSLPETGLVCLLGESGSGKTTLLNTLGCLDSFRSGTVTAAGTTVKGKMSKTAERLRSEKFGYIFQNYFLLQQHTVTENLMVALAPYDLSEEEKQQRIEYVLKAVDMMRYRKRRVSQLSGGQQQRVAIGRALVKASSVIFADEPTGNLDEANTTLVMGILKKISRGCLVIVATHEKRIAEFFADRIISICDGKVISDVVNDQKESYRFSDDSALYLDEYEHAAAKSDRVSVDYYGSGSVSLTLVEDRGRLYISAPEGVKIEVVNGASETQFKKGARPELSVSELNELAYELPRASVRGEGRLSFKEIRAMARKGLSSGARLIAPIIAMLATAVMCMVSVADFMTLLSVDKEKYISSDSRYLYVTMYERRESDISVSEVLRDGGYDEIVNEIEKVSPGSKIYVRHSVRFTVGVRTFEQLFDTTDTIHPFTVTPLSLFDESTLILGRMPRLPNEVIIDRWVLESFMNRPTTLSRSITDLNTFLGMSMPVLTRNYSVTVVGVCDSNQPDVYIDDFAGLGMCVGGTRVSSLSMLQAAYPGEYDNVELGDYEALVNEEANSYINWKGFFESTINETYTVKGRFHAEYPAVFTISDRYYERLKTQLITEQKMFTVFTNDREAVKDLIYNNLSTTLTDAIRFEVTDSYGNQIEILEEQRTEQIKARMLVSIMITLISFVVLAVVMKANAVGDLPSVAVYRLLGISKGNISTIYALQALVLSLRTTWIAVLLTAGVLAAVGTIESLEINLVVSLPAALITATVLTVVNVLTAIIPIGRLLRIPPAQLAAQYDI